MTPREWIRASEIQAFRYCARSWWLRQVLGLEPEDWGQFTGGAERHRHHGRQVAGAERVRRVAVVALVGALLLVAIAAAVWMQGG